jgi:serine/threonine-protein kinase
LSTVPTDLGRYRLDRTLGSGGMAIVYLAHDRELGRAVAVKLLADNLAHDPTFRDRFLREAQLAAPLSHPNVVRVYDSGQDDDCRPYIVMEYVEGGSLADALARYGALSLARVLEVARDTCSGLAYAHAAGLVHRDLKPQNLLLDSDGRVKIADFGIARLLDGTSLTLTGSVLGTAGYLAPEQAGGAQVSAAADIYGLGVTLHQLATGTMPAPDAPQALPEPLRGVIACCLDPDPGRRPSAAALAAMLDEPVTLVAPPADRPTAATLVAPPRTAQRRVAPGRGMRNGRLAAVLLAVLVVAALVIVAATSGGSSPTTRAKHHHAARHRTAAAIPQGATPAAQARLLARWLRQHAG